MYIRMYTCTLHIEKALIYGGSEDDERLRRLRWPGESPDMHLNVQITRKEYRQPITYHLDNVSRLAA